VRAKRTTTCCSAVVLIVLSVSTFVRAQPQADAPLSLFPLRGLWTLALNNALSAPPGFLGARGYFPIEGGRLLRRPGVTLLWIVKPRPWRRR
jgi:hypothetical protein